MKVTFTVDHLGKVFASQELKNNVISMSGLKTAIEIQENQETSVFELLSHKVIYIVVPIDQKNDRFYSSMEALLVNTGEKVKVFTKFGFFDIENDDFCFTTKDEAVEYALKHIVYEIQCDYVKHLEKELESEKLRLAEMEEDI